MDKIDPDGEKIIPLLITVDPKRDTRESADFPSTIEPQANSIYKDPDLGLVIQTLGLGSPNFSLLITKS